MPPQNAVELVPTKSDGEKPKNGNLNNNTIRENLKLELNKVDEVPEPTKATIVIPPDGGFGWVVMFASFCCNVVVDGIVFSSGMFIEPIKEDFGASKASVALVGSLLSGFYLIIGPFVSALANRYGFRAVTIFGSFFSASAFAMCVFAPNVFYLHFFYGVLGGIGFCFIYMPSVIIVGYYFEKWRPLATGIALCGSGVGCFIMAPISRFLIESYGWRNALLAQAVMILLCGIFAIAYRPIEPTVVSDSKEDDLLEKKSLMSEGLPSPAFTKVLPEGRFAYSVPSSSHNTWMGTANNTTYPTAAEIFKGSGANLDRRPSQQSGVLTQINIHSTTKKLEQFKQAQKRSGHVTPTEDYPHPPPVLSALNAHHELGPVGEAEEVEESENGTLLHQNEVKAMITAAANAGRRHTVSGRRPGLESNSRRGSKHDVSRPMYRDDIFFSGSLAKLPQYRSQSSLGYHMSVTHMPTRQDIEEDEEGGACRMCPEAVRRTLSTMLDVSLFKDYSFIMLVASGFLTMMGFFVPFIYITDRAKVGDIDADTAVFLVSSIGVFNTIARIVFGWLSSLEGINALHLNNIFIFVGGIATMFSGIFMQIYAQYAYTAIFGMACACLSALRSIIVVDLLGLDKLTNAFGIILLFQGIAAVMGSPLAGFLYDVTGSYDVPFYVAGGLIALSAVLTMPLKTVKNWQQKRDNRRKIAIAA